MGISKEILIFGLLAILVVIILIFAFILVGIQAFSIPGAFGSVVNSAFPALGGGGYSKGAEIDKD